MTPSERDHSYEWIIGACVYGVGSVDALDIDKIGILAATEIAMQQAVKQIAAVQPNLYLLVDGRDRFWFDHPHSSIVRGDQSERCIGAASIIAKVTRDRRMVALHEEFPHYGFDVHKGYGTPEHYSAITKYGFSAMHRRTFCRGVLLGHDELNLL
jgi:ribonuclease HII